MEKEKRKKKHPPDDAVSNVYGSSAVAHSRVLYSVACTLVFNYLSLYPKSCFLLNVGGGGNEGVQNPKTTQR